MDPTIRCNEITDKFLAFNNDEKLHKEVVKAYELPIDYYELHKTFKITEEGKIALNSQNIDENNKDYCSWNISNDIRSIVMIKQFYTSLVGSLEQPEDSMFQPCNSPSDHGCRRIGKIVLNHCNIFDHEISDKNVSGKEFFKVFDTMKNTLGENYFNNISYLLNPWRFFCSFIQNFNSELEEREYLFDMRIYSSRTLSSHVDRMYLKIITENGQIYASLFQIRDFKIQQFGWEEWKDVSETKYFVFRIDVNLSEEKYKNARIACSETLKVSHSVNLFDDLDKAKIYINQYECGFSNKVFNILKRNRDTNIRFHFPTIS